MLSEGFTEASSGILLEHDLSGSPLTERNLSVSTTEVLPLIKRKVRRSVRYPFAQHILAHIRVACGLRHRHAPFSDQPDSLKLEFPVELPLRSSFIFHLNKVSMKPPAAQSAQSSLPKLHKPRHPAGCLTG
jgi:hypothetical protein